MDVKPYNMFEGSQDDINRRLLHKIEELEARVAELESSASSSSSGS